MKEYIEREALALEVLGLTIAAPAVAQYADAVLSRIQDAPAAKVIEAPCDIGDVFYKPNWRSGSVQVRVSGLTKKANGAWKIRLTENSVVYEITERDIGRQVFRTEEEAEAKLNEGVH